MKKATVFALVVTSIVCSFLCSNVAVSDTGKMMIYRHRWRMAPQPARRGTGTSLGVGVVKEPAGSNTQPDPNKLVNNGKLLPSPASKSPADYLSPEQRLNPSLEGALAYNDRGGIEYAIRGNSVRFGTFREGFQRAVIAWNGFEDERGEETLILTTNEESATGESMAMLSVLPLPGKPLSIERSDPEVFNKAKKKWHKKITSLGNAVRLGRLPDFDRQIGPHNIFVWELDNVDTFKQEVTAYVAQQYGNEAAALIDENTEKVIGEYFKRGFRYFVFDLTLVSKNPTDKVAISYRFKSPYVYYPLQISQVGGTTSPTMVELIIFTPGQQIQTTGVVKIGEEDDDAWIAGNQSVSFTMAEVAELHPELAKVFTNSNPVSCRDIMFEGDLNGFDGDFTATDE